MDLLSSAALRLPDGLLQVGSLFFTPILVSTYQKSK